MSGKDLRMNNVDAVIDCHIPGFLSEFLELIEEKAFKKLQIQARFNYFLKNGEVPTRVTRSKRTSRAGRVGQIQSTTIYWVCGLTSDGGLKLA